MNNIILFIYLFGLTSKTAASIGEMVKMSDRFRAGAKWLKSPYIANFENI